MTTALDLPSSIAEVVARSLQRLHHNLPSATACVVATVDGRLLDQTGSAPLDGRRVAAMIGSTIALGETIGREVDIGRSQYVVVHALNGLLLMLRIPAQKEILVVASLVRQSSNLGVLLHETRRAAQEIGVALDQWLNARPVPASLVG